MLVAQGRRRGYHADGLDGDYANLEEAKKKLEAVRE